MGLSAQEKLNINSHYGAIMAAQSNGRIKYYDMLEKFKNEIKDLKLDDVIMYWDNGLLGAEGECWIATVVEVVSEENKITLMPFAHTYTGEHTDAEETLFKQYHKIHHNFGPIDCRTLKCIKEEFPEAFV
jgi:hypothetical protein